ncbi:hypothetical protein D1872_277950 [compost metagenome]
MHRRQTRIRLHPRKLGHFRTDFLKQRHHSVIETAPLDASAPVDKQNLTAVTRDFLLQGRQLVLAEDQLGRIMKLKTLHVSTPS